MQLLSVAGSSPDIDSRGITCLSLFCLSSVLRPQRGRMSMNFIPCRHQRPSVKLVLFTRNRKYDAREPQDFFSLSPGSRVLLSHKMKRNLQIKKDLPIGWMDIVHTHQKIRCARTAGFILLVPRSPCPLVTRKETKSSNYEGIALWLDGCRS